MLLFLEPHLLSVSMELAEERCIITVITPSMEELTGENHGHRVSITPMVMLRFSICSINQKLNQKPVPKLRVILGNTITMLLLQEKVSIPLKRASKKTCPLIPSQFIEVRTGFSKTTLCTKRILLTEQNIHQRKELTLELDSKDKTSGD